MPDLTELNPSVKLPDLDPRQFELENYYRRMNEPRFFEEKHKIGFCQRKGGRKGSVKKDQDKPVSSGFRAFDADRAEKDVEQAKAKHFEKPPTVNLKADINVNSTDTKVAENKHVLKGIQVKKYTPSLFGKRVDKTAKSNTAAEGGDIPKDFNNKKNNSSNIISNNNSSSNNNNSSSSSSSSWDFMVITIHQAGKALVQPSLASQ